MSTSLYVPCPFSGLMILMHLLFQPDLKPIIPDEVQKVAAAVRQAIQTPRILEKLLSRIQVSTSYFDAAFRLLTMYRCR